MTSCRRLLTFYKIYHKKTGSVIWAEPVFYLEHSKREALLEVFLYVIITYVYIEQ
jgi:hypothetical protein